MGTVFAAMNSMGKEEYSGWTAKWVDKFITKSTSTEDENHSCGHCEGEGFDKGFDEIQPGEDNDLDKVKDFTNEPKPYKNKIDGTTVLHENIGNFTGNFEDYWKQFKDDHNSMD